MTPEKYPESPIALMIDLETLSLSPTAFVTQFGLAIGNCATHEMLETHTLWIERDQPYGRIDLSTQAWWDTQNPEIKKAVMEGPNGVERYSSSMLFNFIKGRVERYPDCTVWGSPAMFDLPILTHLFGGRKPWKYNYERDMMTLYKELDRNGDLCPPPNERAHDAGADAEWQLRYLFNLKGRMNTLKAAIAAASVL